MIYVIKSDGMYLEYYSITERGPKAHWDDDRESAILFTDHDFASTVAELAEGKVVRAKWAEE